jgi:hypothetical protein
LPICGSPHSSTSAAVFLYGIQRSTTQVEYKPYAPIIEDFLQSSHGHIKKEEVPALKSGKSHSLLDFIFKRNTPQLAAVGMKGMRIQLGLVSA